MNGYEALREGAAWIDVSSRGRIRVVGEDRARLLHAMSTNDIQKLKPGQGSYAFLLSAQGRVLADINVFCRAEDFLLDSEAETRIKIFDHLDKFIIADDATLEDITGSTAAIALEGPRAAEVLTKAGAPVPEHNLDHAEWGSRTVARASLTGGPGFILIAPAGERAALIELLEKAGAVPADQEAIRLVRLEHGRPRYGDDITERYLTQETNQMHAVSFQKGCYLGQEIVERVRSRAQIHRRLLPLRIAGTAVPEPGTKLQANGKDAAEITSAAYSPGLGCVVALAYVRIDSKPGDTLSAGDYSATVLAEPPAANLESESSR